jgi:hypothetical protein
MIVKGTLAGTCNPQRIVDRSHMAACAVPHLALLSSWEPDLSRTCGGCGLKTIEDDGVCSKCGTRKGAA